MSCFARLSLSVPLSACLFVAGLLLSPVGGAQLTEHADETEEHREDKALVRHLAPDYFYPNSPGQSDRDFNPFEGYSLPEIGDIASATISLEEEKVLGNRWLQSLRASAPVLEDPLVQSYVENLLNRLAETSELQDRDLTVVVLLDPAINAFAVPGGIIGINSGLLTQARTEGELAAVLTHELAHLSQRHHSRRIKSDRVNSIAGLILILSTILAAASNSSADAGIAAIYAGTAALQARSLNFSRRDEREADRVGMRNLARANYHPINAGRMFETLNNLSKSSNRPPEYLITHPYTENRIADMRARAEQVQHENRPWIFDQPIYQIIRTRAGLLESPPLQESLMKFEAQLGNASGSERIPATYGLAYLYSRVGKPDQALQLLDDLGKQSDPAVESALALLRAEILVDNGKNKAALEWISASGRLLTGDYVLSTLRARSLVGIRQYGEAEQTLRTLRALHPNKPTVWRQLAEMQLLVGNNLAYHQSSARYEELSGRYLRALRHLQEALEIAQKQQQEQLEEVIARELERMAALVQQAGFY